ncbi:hypothetical protein LPJ70_003777, partial [Coemansia sp. RSA 2708]
KIHPKMLIAKLAKFSARAQVRFSAASISTNAGRVQQKQQQQQQQAAGQDIRILDSEIEAARHHERAVAQDAANAATFGEIRVLPAASARYHRVCEMHGD